jgi:hypothetical protein
MCRRRRITEAPPHIQAKGQCRAQRASEEASDEARISHGRLVNFQGRREASIRQLAQAITAISLSVRE